MKIKKRLFRNREKAVLEKQEIVDDQVQDPNENKMSRWLVMVPYMRYIEPETERKLRAVEKLGIPVSRIGGCSEIGLARNQMASNALMEGFESILFIDSDIVFNEMDVVKFFERDEFVLAGSYPQKKFGKLNVDIPSSYEKLSFGTAAPPEGYWVNHVGSGFLRIKTCVLKKMIEEIPLPCCTFHGGRTWPFFLQFLEQEANGEWSYLGEDYAFCSRLTRIGVPIIADLSVRLFHLGLWPFGWEEACNLKIERYAGLTILHDSVERVFEKRMAAEKTEANGQPVAV